MTTRAKCQALAKRLGCEIEVERPRSGKLVQIHLPDGMQQEGNPGLNVLCHNCEADEDIWPGVYADMQLLDGGMEPIAKTSTPKDQVICIRQGEYEVMVDGNLYGTWDSLDVAQVGLLVEQRRAAARRARTQ